MHNINSQDPIQELRKAVENFATVLNAGESDLLPGLFTEEGKFMPEGLQTLNASLLQASSKHFLSKNSFQIAFHIEDINLEDTFASVIATAKTSEKMSGADSTVEKNSRDFFVFKKVNDAWKIHRYIFNNVR